MFNMNLPVIKRRSAPKQKFSPEEDELLRRLVAEYGEFEWEKIASKFNNRNARQCHDRWKFYLNPKINKAPFTQEEDWRLINLVSKYGGMWVQISKQFKNRSDVQMKNRWKALQKQMQKNLALYCCQQQFPNCYQPTQTVCQEAPVTYTQPAVEKVTEQATIPDDLFDFGFESNMFGIDSQFLESYI